VPRAPNARARRRAADRIMVAPEHHSTHMHHLTPLQGADADDPGYRLPTDALVIHVRGVAYKGTVEITTRPPERPALRG
jgi:hypothetical protein